MKMSDKVYNTLKWVTCVVLPALGALYAALAYCWGFGYVKEVLATLAAVEAFLGVTLNITSTKYDGDGTLNIDLTDPLNTSYQIDFNKTLVELQDKKTVLIKVNRKNNK